MSDAGYSFSLTTFSPSGKLLQIEHALKAVSGGTTSLGIQGAQRCKCVAGVCDTVRSLRPLPRRAQP